MSVCVCLFLHVSLSLLSLCCLLFPPSLSILSPVCLSLSSCFCLCGPGGVSVSLTTSQPVPNTLFEFPAISPWLAVPLPLRAELDDMEFLSCAYVFRHLIVPLADTAGTCGGGEWSSWTLRIFQGLVEVEGSVQVTGVLEATVTFRIAFFSTSRVTLGKVRCFCSLSLSFLICKMGTGLPSKVVLVIWCKTVC